MSDIAVPAARTVTRVPAPARRPARPARSARSARRILQILLGMVWLLDAALQFQPYMFSTAFAAKIIDPAAAGNPALIAAPITWSARLMAEHIVAANTAFALTQLAIAAGLLCRRTVKLALAASIGWSAMVWWFGEGLGGTLTGASPLAGLPGAVILYALIALLLWPAREHPTAADGLAPALRGPLGPVIPKLLWLILWADFAWYLLLPGNRAANAVSQAFTSMAAGQPGWLRFVQHGLAALTAGHGPAVAAVLATGCVLTGSAIFVPRLTRPVLILASVLALLIWIAEGLGGLTTGQATDPNTGPLLILLAVCFWPPLAARSRCAADAPAGQVITIPSLADYRSGMS
jgi:hypothetical protein